MEATIIGELDPTRHNLGHDLHYFHQRGTWLDLRGPITIDPQTEFGFGVKIVTASHKSDWMFHDDSDGKCMMLRLIRIEAKVWVCSFAMLFNCVIEEGAIVGMGSVVCNMTVPGYSMVMGNPARVVKRYVGGEWVKGE